jgi:WD40 repeat protein
MKRLARAALTAMSIALIPVMAAGEPRVWPHGHVLRFVRKIGVGWPTDKPGWMSYVAFSPNGRMVASDGPAAPGDASGGLSVWSFPTGRLIRRTPTQTGALSPDWKYAIGVHGVSDANGGRSVTTLGDNVFAVHAFSPNGRYVAEAIDRQTDGSPRIRVLDLVNGKPVGAFGRHNVSSLAISPDGRTLASGHWDLITLWNLKTGERLGVLRGFGRYVDSLAFSKNGALLAAGTDTGGMQIWNVRHRRRLHALDIGGGEVSTPAFSPDGRLVAVGIYGTGAVWLIDALTGRPLDSEQVSDIGCGSVAFSPDGRFLITPSTGGLVKWPYDQGGTIRVFRVALRARVARPPSR